MLFLIHIFQNLFIGHQHTLGHLTADFIVELGIGDHGADKIHSQGLGPLFLGEVILSVGFEELVIRTHEATHLIDQIPEDFHAAHTQEVLGAGILVSQRIGQAFCQTVNGGIGAYLVGGKAGPTWARPSRIICRLVSRL